MENLALTESTYYILLSLYHPQHGYGIMQQTEQLSGGRVHLAAGTLYGALTSLCEKGWIRPLPTESGSRKKEYDYIGCGPFRFTTTKKDLSPVLGLEGYRSIILQMKEANIHLPIVAIGGITLEDIPSIMETGITGIALSGTILRAKDPVAETKRIMNL